MAEKQLVLFLLDKEIYGVPINQVKEIILYAQATRLPTVAAYIEGIISLRGKIVPVIDLAKKLNLDISKNKARIALIVEADNTEIGILVDDVTEVICLQDSAIELLPVGITNKYISGIGKVEGRLLILLDINELFSEEELNVIKQAG